MGIPPIVTNFSGPAAYLTARNAHPLPVSRTLPGGFAEPSVRSIRKALRRALREAQSGASDERGAIARADMVKWYSHRAVGDIVLQRLAAIQGGSAAAGRRGRTEDVGAHDSGGGAGVALSESSTPSRQVEL